MIYFDDSGDFISEPLLEHLKLLTKKCLTRHNKAIETEVSCSFVTEDEIQQLNRKYRNKDTVTDVLSFPVPDILINNHALGDIVICASAAKAQAETYGHSFEREIAFLYVHGLLHLLGYDHENNMDEQTMRGEQRAVLHEDEK